MSLAFPFFAGILAFLSPCIVPMVTIYLSLITGLTVDELLDKEARLIQREVVVNTVFFVAGFALVYIAAGAAAGYVGHFLTVYQTTLNQVGGVIIILLGLRFAGLFKWLPVDPFALVKRLPLNPGSAPAGAGAFGVGIVFAVICSHCFGGLLTSVLVYAGVRGSQAQGALSLALFSLGLAIPFMITAFAVTTVVDRLKAAQRYARTFSLFSGIFLIVFGILTVSGRYTDIMVFLGKLSPLK